MTILSPKNDFIVREFKPFEKNTLRGFLSLELPSGLVIHGIAVHEKSDGRWVGMPAREYQKDGERSWVPIIEFATKQVREAFQEAALGALDGYLAEEAE